MALIDLVSRDGWENLASMAERTMLRLLLVIDRRGRFDGRLPQLALALWPLGDGPSPVVLGEQIALLQDRGLLTIYHVDNLPYVLVHGTKGTGDSKWPGPPNEGQISYIPNPADPEIIRLPCTRGQEYVVLTSHVDAWRDAYPGIDIGVQLQRMLLWLKSHPKELKTRRGIGAFVHRWLGKQQDQGGRALFRPSTSNKSLAVTGFYGDR